MARAPRTIYLAVADGSADDQGRRDSRRRPETEITRRMTHNILIVDDSATTRAMVRRIVTLCGTPTGTIYQAADGLEALAVLGTEAQVDLVLADLHMPNMGGLEMTRRMQAHPVMKQHPGGHHFRGPERGAPRAIEATGRARASRQAVHPRETCGPSLATSWECPRHA